MPLKVFYAIFMPFYIDLISTTLNFDSLYTFNILCSLSKYFFLLSYITFNFRGKTVCKGRLLNEGKYFCYAFP
jgi:hypothetical protein